MGLDQSELILVQDLIRLKRMEKFANDFSSLVAKHGVETAGELTILPFSSLSRS